MLCIGENERADAVAALKGQRFTNWELVTLENLPNKQAHDELYHMFMEEAGNFSHFLKLDADMVFRRDTALQDILDVFGSVNALDWLMLDVQDWCSGTLIPGLQIFSNRVRWPPNPDLLMVDHAPHFPGCSLRLSEPPAPVADHSPNPSGLQVFRFGIHRALKALQDDRTRAERQDDKAAVHWSILNAIWRRYRIDPDRRRALAIAGAEFAMRGGMTAFGHDYMHHGVEALFRERFEPMPAGALLEYIGADWDDPARNDSRWRAHLGA
jgi:hypothetical protein